MNKMSRIRFSYLMRVVPWLLCGMAIVCNIMAQEEFPVDYNFTDGAPGPWPKTVYYLCCAGPEPRTGVFNADAASPSFPFFSYPLRGVLFVGLNDTIQVPITFKNRTDSDYSLAGKKPESWFVPRVYLAEMDGVGVLWRDSTDLDYALRGWYKLSTRTSSPAKIPARQDGGLSLMMDVWDLPKGTYCLCLDTTGSVPTDFEAFPRGYIFEYRKPRSVADSVNAYEANFWRMVRDTNYVAAKNWIDTILTVNETSVPGWWLRAMYYGFLNDTTEIVTSYDKALQYLTSNSDPAMPDSTKRLLLPPERDYVHWVRERLEWERSQYGP